MGHNFSINSDFFPSSSQLFKLVEDLYPIHRCLLGTGNRQTLDYLGKIVKLDITSLSSGTEVFDWVIPPEWHIQEATLIGPNGQKVVDYTDSNLHILQYSQPFEGTVKLAELKEHLFTLPEHPDWIPYRTSYYKENWGFCLPHKQMMRLKEGDYKVSIKCEFKKGHLDYAECIIPGQTEDEVLITAHICHPSLCNDNLSGIAVATHLAKYISAFNPKFTYRFLFSPATLGPIAWLCQNEHLTKNIVAGFTLALLGSDGPLHYKKSRRGDSLIDTIFAHTLQYRDPEHVIREFTPYGYDERQFCSPGFNLPMGCLTRTPNGCFPEYHTSADNLSFIHKTQLLESFVACLDAVYTIEKNCSPVNLFPKGEPQLGKRGVYDGLQGKNKLASTDDIILWLLNQTDGSHSLLDIAKKSGYSFNEVASVAHLLQSKGLLTIDQKMISKEKR